MANGIMALVSVARNACEGCGKSADGVSRGLCPSCKIESHKAVKAFKKRVLHGRERLPPVLFRAAKREAAKHKLHNCIVCGAGFYPKVSDRTKCCGRDCGLAFSGMKAKLEKSGGRVWVRAKRKACINCGKMHGRASPICSQDCRSRAAGYEPIYQAICRECGNAYDRRRDGATRYMCSATCFGQAARRSKRSSRARRKALERGAKTADLVDPLAVFARDGWKCRLCGKRTPIELRGTQSRRAPELDHILPLSVGGKHEWANVQCACRECNSRKGARPMGQLMLFPAA